MKRFAIILISIILLNVPTSFAYELFVQFIDVGQADCTLLISEGEALLIDGGNAADSKIVRNVLAQNNVNELTYVIQTHAHEDHMGGLVDLANSITIDTLIRPVTVLNSKIYSDFEAAIATNSIKSITPCVGDKFIFGKAIFTILGPIDEPVDDINNTSIVCKVDFGNNSFLFMGDASFDEENQIINNNYYIDADVLKVGHHGSKTASGTNFLNRVTPMYSVISVGQNNIYKHPTQDTLSRLIAADSVVYRTDLNGNITMHSDGTKISVVPERGTVFEQGSTIYIGNIKSKIFHLDTCGNLPQIGNRVYFESRQEALDVEYTPCGICCP